MEKDATEMTPEQEKEFKFRLRLERERETERGLDKSSSRTDQPRPRSSLSGGLTASRALFPPKLLERLAPLGESLVNVPGAILEPPAKMMSSGIVKPLSEIAGFIEMAKHKPIDEKNPEGAREAVRQAGTYEPRTEWGKTVAESPLHPINVLGRGLEAIGETSRDVIAGGQDATTLRGMAGNATKEAIAQAAALGLMKASPTVQRGMGNVALLGAPLAYDAGMAMKQGVKNIIEPHLVGGPRLTVGRTMNKAAGTSQPAVVQELQAAPKNVHGQRQTAAQAAVAAESPEFSALQTVAEAVAPKPYHLVGKGQQLNRKQFLEELAGGATDVERAATRKTLTDAREAATKPLYQQVEQSQAIVKTRPVMKVLTDILGKNEKTDSIAKPLRMIQEKLIDELPTGQRVLDTNVNSLASVSAHIKDMINAKTVDGQPQYNVTALKKVKDSLDVAIGKAESAYTKARDVYAKKSVPVNRLDVGGALADKLLKPTGKESVSSYLTAADDAAKTITSSTGQRRYQSYKDLFSPQQTAGIERLTKEFQRDLQLKDLATKGLPAAKKMLEEAVGKIDAPNMLYRPAMFGHYMANRLQGLAAGKTLDTLGKIMLDPHMAAQAMLDVPLPLAHKSAIRNAILQRLGEGTAASLPAQRQP